jgi:hypothetical protein
MVVPGTIAEGRHQSAKDYAFQRFLDLPVWFVCLNLWAAGAVILVLPLGLLLWIAGVI